MSSSKFIMLRRSLSRQSVNISNLQRRDAGDNAPIVVRVELDDDEVGDGGDVVGVAEGEVCGVCATHGAVGELGGGMGEDAVPPLEEAGWVAFGRYGVVSGAVAGRDWLRCEQRIRSCTRQEHVPEPPRTLIVTGSPDRALWMTR